MGKNWEYVVHFSSLFMAPQESALRKMFSGEKTGICSGGLGTYRTDLAQARDFKLTGDLPLMFFMPSKLCVNWTCGGGLSYSSPKKMLPGK